MMSNVDQLLQQAITTAQAGDNSQAQQLFMQVVELDERNELAWSWLANLVHDPQDKRVCLENVLAINPANEQAKRSLAALTEPTAPVAPPPEAGAPPPPTPSPSPPPAAAPVPATPAPAPPPSATVPAPGSTAVTYTCPRCGEPATKKQPACTNCRSSLMVSDPPVATTSIFVKVLGWLWVIGGALPILGVLIVAFGVSYIASNLAEWHEYNQDPWAYAQEHAEPDAEQPLNPEEYAPAQLPEGIYLFAEAMRTAQETQATGPSDPTENPFEVPVTFYLTLVVPSFIYGGVKIFIGLGITARKMWAYILNIVELVWNIGGALLVILLGGVLIGLVVSQAGEQGVDVPASSVESLQAGLATFTIALAIPVVIQFLLTALSYPSFFGMKRYRFAPTDTPNHTDEEHYRRGSYYGKKGLWAAAAHEWEMAAKVNSHNPHYHHALGLAYTELHEYKKAMGEFQKALGMGGSKRELEPLIERLQEMEAGSI